MSENKENPLFNSWDFNQESPVNYSNHHLVTQTNKELHIVFGQQIVPDLKIKPLTKIVLTERHAIELVHSLQSQINLFIKRHKEGLDDEPPKRN